VGGWGVVFRPGEGGKEEGGERNVEYGAHRCIISIILRV